MGLTDWLYLNRERALAMPSLDALGFYSEHPIDKVVQEGSVSIFNDGDTTNQDNRFQSSKIVVDTVPNVYGREGLIRARWSINGGNDWQSLYSQIIYTFMVNYPDSLEQISWNLDSAISVGSNTSQIIFRTANGKHGNVDLSDPQNPQYATQSRTFDIQYWMYERE